MNEKTSSRRKVAFIIVCWNNLELLPECFASIREQTYDSIDTYLVDNDSKDKSVGYTEKNFPEAKIIEVGYNSGFAVGNNIGIKKAMEDPEVGYFALLNTDARLDKDWTKRMVEFAESKPHAALLQGTTLDYYNHEIIDSTHIYIAYNGQGTQGNWRHYYNGEMGPQKVFGVNAAACVITRDFVEAQPFRNELFDERMFMYLEDLDLSTRATIMGWDNYLVPVARAYHMGSASSGKNPGFSLYMTFRNNSALLFKNLPFGMLVRMAPHVLRGDLDTIRELRRRGKSKAANRVIKGRVIGVLRIVFYINKRRKMRRANSIIRGYLWRLMRSGN